VVEVNRLADEGDGRLCVVRVALGHVEVIHELNQGHVASNGLECLALLLQRGLQLGLQAHTVGLVVEVDRLEVEVFGIQLLKHTFDQLRLA